MSDPNVVSAPRGRSSVRGGRATMSSRGGRGGRGGHATNGDKPALDAETSAQDAPELTEYKKQYGSKISTIKEMFPNWTDEDIVYALRETNGDLAETVDRIADGRLTPFGEVDTKKDRSRSKAVSKDKESATSTLTDSVNAPRGVRGGRGGPFDAGRGGRGRGSDRGARGGRGRGAFTQSNGSARTKDISDAISVPTEDAWSSVVPEGQSSNKTVADTSSSTYLPESVEKVVESVSDTVSNLIPAGAKKSWASMFAKESVPEMKPLPAALPAPASDVEEIHQAESDPVHDEPVAQETPIDAVTEVQSPVAPKIPSEQEQITPPPEVVSTESVEDITPSKDELTETNLEQLPDTSAPIETETVASTAASSWAPRNENQQQPSAVRPAPISGFAATAQKATAIPLRQSSYQRRTLDQEEVVRMPGNRDVDRAAVQFGNFNIGSEEDVDGEREDAETRAQPPQHSPIAQPRAALPPTSIHQQSVGLPASLPSPRDAPGLVSAPLSAPGLPSPHASSNPQGMAPQTYQSPYGLSGRFGAGAPQEQAGFGQKQYDAFGQQAPGIQNQYDVFPGQQNHSQGHPQNAFSSAPYDASSYYTADGRNSYSQYYGQQYGQQVSHAQEAAGAQRGAGGYNAGTLENTSAHVSSPAAFGQSRYGATAEGNNSGNNTPNPTTQGQQGTGQTSSQSHLAQQHGSQGQYPSGHPYSYGNSYYGANNYNQYYGASAYNQSGYGASPYGGKGAMYGQSRGYGMPPQAPYDSPSSSAFGQSSASRDVAATSGDSYGAGQETSGRFVNPYGAMGDYGSTYGHGGFGQQTSQGEDLKPYGDNKTGNGPSPLLSQAARPGSAVNSNPGQSALPPPQSSQGYGGYPSHLQGSGLHNSQANSHYGGGLGGVGAYGQGGTGHQSNQYGSYGQTYGNSSYGGRGGWGQNYGGGQGH